MRRKEVTILQTIFRIAPSAEIHKFKLVAVKRKCKLVLNWYLDCQGRCQYRLYSHSEESATIR